MKLFTKTIDKKLFAQYDKGSDLKNQKVIAKIFNPYGRGTWYILNSDPEDPDYLWAITDLFEIEIGSVSRNELENIKVPPFRLPLERDMYFDEINAYELYQGLKEGKRYDDGGETTKVDEFGSMSFRGVYDDYEMIVISKESEKDGGEIHTDRFLVSAKDINEAKKITEDLWRKNFNDSDLSIVKIMSEEAYRFKKINGLDIYYNGGYMDKGGEIPIINLSYDDKLNYFIKKENNSGDLGFVNDMLTQDYKGKKFYSLGYDTKSKGHVFSLDEAKKNAKVITGSELGKKWDVIIKEVGGYFSDDDFTKTSYVVMTSPLFPREMLREMQNTLEYAKGGYMADGGQLRSYKTFVEEYPDKKIYVRVKFAGADKDVQNYTANEENKKRAISFAKRLAEKNNGTYEGFKIYTYAKGGYMANGGEFSFNTYKLRAEGLNDFLSFLKTGMYTRIKSFTVEPIGIPDVNVSFVTDASLSEIKSKLREVSDSHVMLETIKPINEFTGERNHIMAKGGFLKDAKYVSKRNISSITLEVDGKSVTLKGEDLVDGVYVKKTQSATKSATKTKVDAKEVANKLSDLYYDVWDKLKIESGSQIYSSDATQKKLNKELKAIGIDEIYSKLTKPERKKVSDILTDENQHSLRNYLGLRGYNGEQEYNSYKNMYEDNIKDYKRAFTLNPKNFDRVLAEGGGLGDSTYLVKVAEEYAEKEYGKKVKKGAGVAKAKKVGDKYDYSQVTVFFQDGTQETFDREDFEEFFEIED